MSYNAKNFIDLLIVKDPERRMSAQEALQHPWLRYFSNLRNERFNETNINDKILLRLKNYRKPRLIKREAMKILLRIIEEKQVLHLKQEF